MKYGRFNRLAVLAAAVLMLLVLCVTAYADEAGTRWGTAADDIDKLVDAGFEAYMAGDAKTAYQCVNDGYFKIYEVTGFERQTMSYISGPRKNAIELEFSACKGAVKKSNADIETQKEVRTELNKLKSMIREDANKLAVKDGEPTTLTKYYVNGEQVDYDPYADLAGDPNAPKKYESWAEASDSISELLDTSFTGYKGKDFEAALDNVNTAYYAVYEQSGLSQKIYSDLSIEDRESVDSAFEALKMIAKSDKFQRKAYQLQINKTKKAVASKCEMLDAKDAEAKAAQEAEALAAAQQAAEQTSSASSGIVIFAGAFGIIAREGLEAILVVAAIIAYLVKSGMKKNLKSVYLGACLGIVASFAAALVLVLVKAKIGDAFGAQAQEVMEGCTALVAVCVLFYVSNWMLSKSEAANWTHYIDSKVKDSVETGSSFALGFAAFLSVFREGAEVVLFYQPMLTQDGNPKMVVAGFLTGCVLLVFVFLAFRYLSIKLPIGPFFTAMSVFMAVMCISFMGSAVKEFAEGGLFDVTQIPWMFTENDITDALGIYPFAEPIFAQLILTCILIATFVASRYANTISRLKKQLSELKKD